jgi:hypothetical protein
MSSPENFDSLQQLLRLKRHEQAPPRYFDEFSSRVMTRIGAGEARLSWWERLGFDLRPALGAATGVLACGLVIYGVATADGDEQQLNAAGSLVTSHAANRSLIQTPDALTAQGDLTAANSTNPVTGYGTMANRQLLQAQTKPANYQLR